MFIPESKLYKPNTRFVAALLEEGEIAVAMAQIGFNSKLLTNRRILFLDATDSKIKEYIKLENIKHFSVGSSAGIPKIDAEMKDGTKLKIGTLDPKILDQLVPIFEETLVQAHAPESNEPTDLKVSVESTTPDPNAEAVDSRGDEERVRTNSLKPFPNWLLKSINEHRRMNEKLLMVITEPYTNHQGALLVFQDRCMIVKGGVIGGFMAGTLGGERAATFYFSQITGIEYNSGFVNGVLEILTPSYQGTSNKDFWQGTTKSRNSNSNDPWTLNNCLPLTKEGYKSARDLIDELKALVADSQRPVSAAPASSNSLGDELAKLADLLRQGILTEEEFASAKKRLLQE